MSLATGSLFPEFFNPANYRPESALYPYDAAINNAFAKQLRVHNSNQNAQTTKLVIWDWDDTSGPLYPVADLTANLAFHKLAGITRTDHEDIATVARTLPGEFICHEPRSMLLKMATAAEATEGMEQLADINKDGSFKDSRVEKIVLEWEQNRREMFTPRRNEAFSSVMSTMAIIKKSGGHNMIVTSSMPGSLKRRMFEGFGARMAQSFMQENVLAVFCRNSIAGLEESSLSHQIASRSRAINDAEADFRKFLASTVKEGTSSYGDKLNYFTGIDEARIKGAAQGHDILLRARAVAESLTGKSIKVSECVKIGDTSSDYKAAHAAKMRLILTVEGTVFNQSLNNLHNLLGCQKKDLDPSALARDVKNGAIRPDHVIARADEALNYMVIHP